LARSKTEEFVQYVDDVYYNSIIKHFEDWHDLSSPLIPDVVIDTLINHFERIFPCTALVFSTASSNLKNNNKAISNNETKKRYLTMTQFLGMNRLRNHKRLTWWAMVESLPQISRDLQKASTINSVHSRHSLAYDTVFCKLKKFTPW